MLLVIGKTENLVNLPLENSQKSSHKMTIMEAVKLLGVQELYEQVMQGVLAGLGPGTVDNKSFKTHILGTSPYTGKPDLSRATSKANGPTYKPNTGMIYATPINSQEAMAQMANFCPLCGKPLMQSNQSQDGPSCVNKQCPAFGKAVDVSASEDVLGNPMTGVVIGSPGTRQNRSFATHLVNRTSPSSGQPDLSRATSTADGPTNEFFRSCLSTGRSRAQCEKLYTMESDAAAGLVACIASGKSMDQCFPKFAAAEAVEALDNLIITEHRLTKRHLEDTKFCIVYSKIANEMFMETDQRWQKLTRNLTSADDKHALQEARDIGVGKGRGLVFRDLAGDYTELCRRQEALGLLHTEIESLKQRKPQYIATNSRGYARVDEKGNIVSW
jgi:hypothetical protein